MIASSLILPPPGEVAAALWRLILSTSFWRAVLGTFSRVVAAFALSIVTGAATGAASGLSSAVRDFLAPLLTTIRATPVLALILVAMFWLPAAGVPVFTAFLMAYPVMHTSVYSGIAETDKELLEMAAVFKVPAKVRFFRLRLPSAETHFLAGAKNALGMCWKVVVAGEVLSQPAKALGTGLQDSRLSLDTAGVLAWAAATVLLCGASEFALGIAARASARRRRGGAL
jgi:NitT/TauT family transport system permease protein